jgi:hypothetical protein
MPLYTLIPALAWSRTPGLALHSTHSYGYVFRSSAALVPAQQGNLPTDPALVLAQQGNYAQDKSLRHQPGSLVQYAV